MRDMPDCIRAALQARLRWFESHAEAPYVILMRPADIAAVETWWNVSVEATRAWTPLRYLYGMRVVADATVSVPMPADRQPATWEPK